MSRIVIVEDDRLVAKYFQYVLQHEGGYEAVVTESGDAVLTLCRESTTSAVIIDVSLRATRYQGRYIDGLQLSRLIRADDQAKRVPIIIATAHAMAGDRERFLAESGANALIGKPIVDGRHLLDIVARVTAT